MAYVFAARQTSLGNSETSDPLLFSCTTITGACWMKKMERKYPLSRGSLGENPLLMPEAR